MRLLKIHRGQAVHVYLDGVTFQGVLVDVAADSVSLRDVSVVDGTGSTAMPGPVVLPVASVAWVAVIP